MDILIFRRGNLTHSHSGLEPNKHMRKQHEIGEVVSTLKTGQP